MIQITKTWDKFKEQQVARSLTINYEIGTDFYVLYMVSDSFFWTCKLDLCLLERENNPEPSDKSQDLLNLEDFENNYLEDALEL